MRRAALLGRWRGLGQGRRWRPPKPACSARIATIFLGGPSTSGGRVPGAPGPRRSAASPASPLQRARCSRSGRHRTAATRGVGPRWHWPKTGPRRTRLDGALPRWPGRSESLRSRAFSPEGRRWTPAYPVGDVVGLGRFGLDALLASGPTAASPPDWVRRHLPDWVRVSSDPLPPKAARRERRGAATIQGRQPQSRHRPEPQSPRRAAAADSPGS